VADAMIETGL